MNTAQAESVMTAIASLWPTFQLNEFARASWVSSLQKVEMAPCLDALKRIHETSESNFAPALGTLLRETAIATNGTQRTGEEAYADVQMAIRRHGRCYGPEDPPPKFSDPLIKDAYMLFGSWNAVCDARESDEISNRSRFIEYYNTLATRGRENLISSRQLPAHGELKQLGSNVVDLLAKVGRAIK